MKKRLFPPDQLILADFLLGILAALVLFWLAGQGQAGDDKTLQTLPAAICQSEHSPHPEHDILRCRVDVVLHDHQLTSGDDTSDLSTNLSLLVPVFRDKIVVIVNGDPVGEARINKWGTSGRMATVPAVVPVPKANLYPGGNSFEFIVSG